MISYDINKPEIEEGKKDSPANMAKNTDWANKNFESWRTTRNQQFPKAQCPDDVFS